MPGSISVDPGAGVDAAVAGESFQCDGKEPSRPVEPSSEDHNCEANDLVQKQEPVKVRPACEDFSAMSVENTGGVDVENGPSPISGDVSPLNGHEVSVKVGEEMGEICGARQVLDKRQLGGDGACKKTVLDSSSPELSPSTSSTATESSPSKIATSRFVRRVAQGVKFGISDAFCALSVSPVWAPILPSSGSTLSFPGALGLGKISHMLDLPVFG
ncbi:hypothetical protein U1Q18_032684 [Sarracenia purpurea var. burkii]